MFGFGKGKVEIQLQKFNYSPGEIIQGTVTFDLKKVINARAANIALIGERIESNFNSNINSTKIYSKNYAKRIIFNLKQQLDKEKEYSGDFSYNFEIKIPEGILAQNQLEPGALGAMIKTAQLLSGSNIRTQWYLLANLDIPGGFDVSKKVQINIT